MNEIERAAEVIGETIAFRTDHDGWPHHGIVTTPPASPKPSLTPGCSSPTPTGPCWKRRKGSS